MLYVLTWRCIVPSPPPNTSPKLHFYIKHFPIQKILSFNPDWSLLSKVQFYLEELEIYRSIHYSVPLLLYIVSNSVPGGAVYQGIGFRLKSWTYQFSHFKQSNCFLPCWLPASERWCSLASADSCEFHDTFWVDIQHMSTNYQNCFHHRYYHYVASVVKAVTDTEVWEVSWTLPQVSIQTRRPGFSKWDHCIAASASNEADPKVRNHGEGPY